MADNDSPGPAAGPSIGPAAAPLTRISLYKLGPPEDKRTFQSYEEGEEYIKNWARIFRFSFAKNAGSKNSGGVHYYCGLGVAAKKQFNKHTEAAAELTLSATSEQVPENDDDQPRGKKRKRSTAKEHCPFKISLKYHKRDGLWHLDIPPNAGYRHSSQPESTLPCQFTDDQILSVGRGLRANLKPSQIYTILSSEYPNATFLMRDIYNLLNKLRTHELRGRSSAQILLDGLEKDPEWSGNYTAQVTGELQRIYLQPKVGRIFSI